MPLPNATRATSSTSGSPRTSTFAGSPAYCAVMTEIDPTAPVLVTGASGYIASWIVRFLLEDGYTVRGTVRNPDRAEKLAHLNKLSDAHPGKLSLFKADLLDDGSFAEAMDGCQLVIHTASP